MTASSTNLEERIKVVDTNVFLTNPENAFESFRPTKPGRRNVMVIPIGVLGEIDKFKGEDNTERGRNARASVRLIDEYKQKYGGNLFEGIPVADNYVIKGAFLEEDNNYPHISKLGISPVDRDIIKLCLRYRDENIKTELVTQDGIVRHIADAVGLKQSDWRAERVIQSEDEINAGWYKVELDDAAKTEFLKGGITLERLEGLPVFRPNLCADNEFIAMPDMKLNEIVDKTYFYFTHPEHSDKKDKQNRWLVGVYDKGKGAVMKLDDYAIPKTFPNTGEPFRARNIQQRLVLDALFNENLKYVSLLGYAGTGKTFLAIAAALMQAAEDSEINRYQKVMIARPLVGAHQTMGFLKGGMNEKLSPWMQPIYDNISLLTGVPGDMVEESLNHLNVEVTSLEHIRGRSFAMPSIVIIDEAQNLTGHETKTILTRAGDYTKFIFTGDPYQIDNHHVNVLNCGLIYAAQRMNDLDYTATLAMNIGERSRLSKDAAQRL
ncbi:MAG: PhoH family protein [Candidatus Woesearchaeota archaeon]